MGYHEEIASPSSCPPRGLTSVTMAILISFPEPSFLRQVTPFAVATPVHRAHEAGACFPSPPWDDCGVPRSPESLLSPAQTPTPCHLSSPTDKIFFGSLDDFLSFYKCTRSRGVSLLGLRRFFLLGHYGDQAGPVRAELHTSHLSERHSSAESLGHG